MLRFLLYWIIGLLLLMSFQVTQAQEPIAVTGMVTDELGKPVIRASVLVAPKTTVTDTAGRFLIRLLPGKYLLRISATEMKIYEKKITIGAGSVELATIVLLAAEIKSLNAVVVKAEKPVIEQKLDRTIVNVSAMIGASSGNVLQLLEKTPGVTVEGNSVSLNGRGAATVMIDNRPTQMSESDLANYLKSLPANTVEKVELIPVPPASYEASGASMINIVLKRNRLQGFSGSLNAGSNAGRYVRGFGNASLNYNYKKLRLMGNIGYNHDAWFSDGRTERVFFDNEGAILSKVLQKNFSKSGFNSLSTRLAVDYDLSKSTSIGAIVNLQRNPGRDRMVYSSESDDRSGFNVYNGYGYSHQQSLTRNYSYNLHALHKFRNDGGQLSFDANHMEYNKRSDMQLNRYSDIDALLYEYNIPTNIKVYNAQADYSWSANENWGLEAGIRTSNVSTHNIFQMSEKDLHQNDIEEFNNNFKYREAVQAGYISVQKKFNRFSAKAGLRGEQTNIRGTEPEVNGHESRFNNAYFSLFPSGFFSYKLDSAGKKNLTLSISRRINRPGFQQLNPFLVKEDDYNFSGGNPMLRPEFNTQFDLRYQLNSKLTFNAIYAGFSQIIFQSLRVTDSLFIRQPENIATGIAAGISANYNSTITQWWRVNTNINVIRLYLNGETFGNPIRQELYTGRLNFFNNFTISPKWKTELNFFYRHKDLNGQTSTKPRWRLNAAIQYEFMAGKAQIRLFADDIFRGWVEDGTTQNLQNAAVYFRRINETRMAGLSFSMRFGSKNNKEHRDTNQESQRL